ncbi:MAG: hypothetical protein ABJF88_15355 [Rhodothermales bacterium]
MRPLFIPITAFAALLSFAPAAAQTPRPTDVIAQGTSYFIFAAPGEATIELLVLGNTKSGVYVVGETTTFTELLALSGGTGASDQNQSVRVERTVRLLREEGGERVVVYEADADEALRQTGAHPTLMNGDMVTVETEVHSRFNLRDTLSIVTSLASVTLLILRLVDSSN